MANATLTPPAAPPARSTDRPGVGWWLVVAGASLIALYALAYVVLGDRMYPPNLVDSFRARPWGIYPHALFGAVAMALGPFQFRRDMLVKRRPLHRTLGKIYVVSALLVGAAGLYMAFYSYGGLDTHLGFGGLALATLFTTTSAWLAVKARRFVEHREWMIRSYAMIFAAVTLRLQMPLLAIATQGDFDVMYAIVAWSCWVPNLIFAEWWIRRSAARERPRVLEIAPSS